MSHLILVKLGPPVCLCRNARNKQKVVQNLFPIIHNNPINQEKERRRKKKNLRRLKVEGWGSGGRYDYGQIINCFVLLS